MYHFPETMGLVKCKLNCVSFSIKSLHSLQENGSCLYKACQALSAFVIRLLSSILAYLYCRHTFKLLRVLWSCLDLSSCFSSNICRYFCLILSISCFLTVNSSWVFQHSFYSPDHSYSQLFFFLVLILFLEHTLTIALTPLISCILIMGFSELLEKGLPFFITWSFTPVPGSTMSMNICSIELNAEHSSGLMNPFN